MIDFQEARALIESHSRSLPAETVALDRALGSVLAENVFSPIALPPFTNSAMDGFVLSSARTLGASPDRPLLFRIAGEIKAGDRPKPLKGAECRRIMTGAAIPSGGDTVVPKEKAQLKDGALSVTAPLTEGRHVRRAGEEMQKGEKALGARSLLHPGTIGFLASLGRDRVRVFRRPRVALIATGNELSSAGKRLEKGKIFDSNGPMLTAALADMRIRPVFSRRVADDPARLVRALRSALSAADVVILTGGVSEGEHDHVRRAAAETGVRSVFWKVRQKPGKPIFFGARGVKLVFGLPGNPASVFTCFYEYAYPAIRILSGHANPYLAESRAVLGESVKPDPEKTLFLKGRVSEDGRTASPLGKQSSHMLSSLCHANALLAVPGQPEPLEPEAGVTVHALPYAV